MGAGIISGRDDIKENVEKVELKPQNNKEEESRKVNFDNIFQQDAKAKAERQKRMDEAAKNKSPDMAGIDKLNEQLSGGSAEDKISKEFEEIEQFTDEELALAEELIFKGYVEFDKKMSIGKDNSITICSMTAEENELVNELVYSLLKEKENDEGDVDMPQSAVTMFSQFCGLALSFKGYNGEDFCKERKYSLALIKSAISKLPEFEAAGDLKRYSEIRDEIKGVIKIRASKMKRIATPVVDYISNQRYIFERKMYSIMNKENILPKF